MTTRPRNPYLYDIAELAMIAALVGLMWFACEVIGWRP